VQPAALADDRSSRVWRARGWLEAKLAHRRAPAVLLAVICILGATVRAYDLGIPAQHHPGEGTIFDESYYVNAARVIAGLHVVAPETYANASPSGTDPNGEHPQLGKIAIAAGIELFGDNSAGWRISAVAFSVAALLLLYWLVRCAGGSVGVALAATALASFENLWLVSGRIAVLDVYCIPFMLAGAAFYLRRRPIVAGALIGVGGCMKLFGLYALFALLGLELMRGLLWLVAQRGQPPRQLLAPVALTLATIVSFFTLLTVIDRIVHPYNNGHRVDVNQSSICSDLLLWSNACNHVAFMNKYGATVRRQSGPAGIASYPWEFWINVRDIHYYTTKVTVRTGADVISVEPTLDFRGVISWVVLATSWPAILLSLWWAIRRRDDLSLLTIAWIAGTWLPSVALAVVDDRTEYLYYMVVVMPGLYIAVARLLARREIPRLLVGVWIGLFVAELVQLYPFRTLGG
jgi:4-amino-4-deoxy-L-arabinose transferase-like glycosyltransferase